MARSRLAEVLRSARGFCAVTGWCALAVALAPGCGDTQGAPGGRGGAAGDPGTGGTDISASIASLTIDAGPLTSTRLGQRWALTATARDEVGDPVGDAKIEWSSSDASVATVSNQGIVTALTRGTASITATSGDRMDAVTVTARSAVPSDLGDMVTLWFARSDPARVAIVDGRLEVFGLSPEVPAPMTPWPHDGVARVASADGRIAILTDVVDGLGTLRVLDPGTEWTLLGVATVSSFQLLGDRIAALDGTGALRMREGLRGDWVTVEGSGVAEFQLLGSRIAILRDDGVLRAKDDLDDAWTTLATGVRSFVLQGDRIAVLLEEGDGGLQVRDGLEGSWVPLEVRVRQVALSGDRIGVVRKDGVAQVKEGIDGPWVRLASSYVEAIDLDGDRVAIQFEGGDLRVRDGVEGPWTIVSTASRRFALEGDSIAVLTEDGELSFQTGLDGSAEEIAPEGNVTEWLSLAEVPVPPARTVAGEVTGPRAPCAGLESWMCPTAHPSLPEVCLDDGPRCKSVAEPGVPLPEYGRFCGVNRPLDDDRDWAIEVGPLDAFDALCMHAEYAESWYPNADPSTVEACIVRYGLTTGRVTRDGVAIESGTPQYTEVMTKLESLGDAILDAGPYETACDADAFDAFLEATRMQE